MCHASWITAITSKMCTSHVAGDKNSSSKGKRSGCGLGTSGYGQGKVGIMVVTIDPPFRLVLGAFVAEGKEGAEGSEKWSYWEEEIGAQELAAHVRIVIILPLLYPSGRGERTPLPALPFHVFLD